ncbi:hypothetical protein PCL_04106 [Purpureocillium lilacinum]|uniref:Epoxidase subunit A n=2 Tax=Purpureocillium lilacinum TaxID=33203 RepID=A0A2U3EQZ1_PURLI|nr:hypothetical protein PCL_04106 [Purpureocillium lilacinum]
MAPLLSPQQLDFYEANGYLILRASEHKLVQRTSDLKKWAEQVRSWPLEKGKWMPYFEVTASGEKQPMRTEKFVDYHEDWRSLICGDGLASILKQIAGEDTLLFKDKINYKLPNGNGFHAHVDYHAYSHIGQIHHITANIAIDEANIANGCLEVVPGSHVSDIEFSQGGRISSAWEDSHNWVAVPLAPGDILLFGSRLAHRSKRNQTDKSRTSLYATYYMKQDGADLRQKYYEHRRQIFPPDHGEPSTSTTPTYFEREEGKDYQQGWKTYGFAAPFSSVSSRA